MGGIVGGEALCLGFACDDDVVVAASVVRVWWWCSIGTCGLRIVVRLKYVYVACAE
jgi:hypothetical protein